MPTRPLARASRPRAALRRAARRAARATRRRFVSHAGSRPDARASRPRSVPRGSAGHPGSAARFAAGLTALALGLAASPALARSLAARGPLDLVTPGEPLAGADTARLAAARNELEGVQVLVAGGADGLRGVRARLTALEGPTSLPASIATLYRVAYLDVRTPSDGNGRTGRLPDPLIPAVDPFYGEPRAAFPFEVPAGELRALWLEVHVPPGTPAGLYRGRLEVEAETGFAESLPVELEVFPFELPSTPSYVAAYGMNWYGPCQAHTGTQDCHGDPVRFDELRRLYATAALDHRISVYAAAGIPPRRTADGGRDFGRYDALLGPLLDGAADTRLAGARLQAVEVTERDPDGTTFAAWAGHFRARGWFDRLFDYTCDEPPLTCDWHEIAPRQAAAHAADPELRTLVTTSRAHAETHGILESTDLLVPAVNFVEGKPGSREAGEHAADYTSLDRPVGDTWLYASCMSHGCGATVGGEYGGDPDLAGWPSHVLDHPPVRHRALPWIAAGRGFGGELYWDTVYALAVRGEAAWRDVYDFTGNGDGTLFYPGTPARIGGTRDIPVGSLRLQRLRDGIEDFEYLALLARYEGEAAARSAALALFPHAWSAEEVTPEALLEARRAIAARIAAHAATRSTGGSAAIDGATRDRPGTPSSDVGDEGFGDDAGAAAPGANGCSAGAGALSLGGWLAAAAWLGRRKRRPVSGRATQRGTRRGPPAAAPRT